MKKPIQLIAVPCIKKEAKCWTMWDPGIKEYYQFYAVCDDEIKERDTVLVWTFGKPYPEVDIVIRKDAHDDYQYLKRFGKVVKERCKKVIFMKDEIPQDVIDKLLSGEINIGDTIEMEVDDE